MSAPHRPHRRTPRAHVSPWPAPPCVYGQARRGKAASECIRTSRPQPASRTWQPAERRPRGPAPHPTPAGVTAQGSSGRQAIPSGVSSPRKAASTQPGLTVVPGRVMAPCCPPGLQRCQPGHGTKGICPLAETADKTAATTAAADPTSPRNDRAICGRCVRCDTMSHVVSRFVDWRFGMMPKT
jgi:hypothetical protein